MKKDAKYIVRCMPALMLVALVCFTACSKDEVAVGNIGVLPQQQQGGQTANVPSDATTYNISIPATFGGADTRAVAFEGTGVVSKFVSGDKVYVYNTTKSAWASGSLSPTDISEDGKSCTLTGTISNAAEGNVLRLFYNINNSNKTFNYESQNGSINVSETGVPAAGASKFDFAEATMKVKEISDGNITLCETGEGGESNTIVVFENLQSMYKFIFTGIRVGGGIGSINIRSKKGKLVESYKPVTNETTYANETEEGDKGITITLTDAVRKANGAGVVYAALRFDPTDDETDQDILQITVTGNQGRQYIFDVDGKYLIRRSKPGGFGNSEYYEATMSLSRTVNLSALTVDYTTRNSDLLRGTLPEGINLTIPDYGFVWFDGVTINNTSTAGLVIQGDANIYLHDESENSISATGDGVAGISSNVNGKTLIIHGNEDASGILRITSAGGKGNDAYNLEVIRCIMDVSGKDDCKTIDVANDLNTDVSHISLQGGNGLNVGHNLTTTSGSVMPYAGVTYAPFSVGNDFTINNGTLISAKGGLTLGNLTLNNGNLTVEGSANAMALTTSNSSNITIKGGTIKVIGGTGQTGFDFSGTLTQTDGTLTITGASGQTGFALSGTLTQSKGTLTVTGGSGGAGLSLSDTDTLTQSGGTLTVTGGSGATGLALSGILTQSGGTLKTTGGTGAAGANIANTGAFTLSNNGSFTAIGGNASVSNGDGATGISSDGNITVNGGQLTATGGNKYSDKNDTGNVGPGIKAGTKLTLGEGISIKDGDTDKTITNVVTLSGNPPAVSSDTRRYVIIKQY